MKQIITALISVSLFVAPLAFADDTAQSTDQAVTSQSATDNDTATSTKKKNCDCSKCKHKKHHKKAKKTDQTTAADQSSATGNESTGQ